MHGRTQAHTHKKGHMLILVKNTNMELWSYISQAKKLFMYYATKNPAECFSF